MQDFIAAIIVFALAGLGLSAGILLGYRGLGGCHGSGKHGQADGCGRGDCCSAAQQPPQLVDLEDRRSGPPS